MKCAFWKFPKFGASFEFQIWRIFSDSIFRLYKTSATYWEGKADQESLQRVYGITYPDKKQLTEWVTLQEEAKKRDHRKIGTEQQLWVFDPLSAGSCFWLPRGTIIYNRLMDFIRGVSFFKILFWIFFVWTFLWTFFLTFFWTFFPAFSNLFFWTFFYLNFFFENFF